MFSQGENARSSPGTRARAYTGGALPRGKGGRPRRRHQLTVSLNDEELASVMEKATRAGLRPSVYLRPGCVAALATA